MMVDKQKIEKTFKLIVFDISILFYRHFELTWAGFLLHYLYNMIKDFTSDWRDCNNYLYFSIS
jgi:hypothetical protein